MLVAVQPVRLPTVACTTSAMRACVSIEGCPAQPPASCSASSDQPHVPLRDEDHGAPYRLAMPSYSLACLTE